MAENVHDPKVLRAIAHPVRNRILAELGAVGPMRAADVARALGIPANQASFHLRQLAKYGLIQEDVDAARDKRDRVWRESSPDGLSVNVTELAQQPGGKAASAVFMASGASWAHHVVDEAYSTAPRPGRHRSTGDSAIRLTKEEAGVFNQELVAFTQAWRERTKGAPDGDEERETYLLHTMLLPYPDVQHRTEDA